MEQFHGNILPSLCIEALPNLTCAPMPEQIPQLVFSQASWGCAHYYFPSTRRGKESPGFSHGRNGRHFHWKQNQLPSSSPGCGRYLNDPIVTIHDFRHMFKCVRLFSYVFTQKL